VFQVRTPDKSLAPFLLMMDSPHQAVQLKNVDQHYSDLGVDRVAIVHAEGHGQTVRITRITDVGMFANGDSTTAKRAMDIIVRDGRLEELVKVSLGQAIHGP
jgi:nitrogen regulatory protein PII